MSASESFPSRTRLVILAVLVVLAAYWAGARWGPREPVFVGAGPAWTDGAGGPLASDEEVNVRVYRQAAPAVANIFTRTVTYDFFFEPVPQEGAGSGFLIDAQGHVLTNYHVVQGAQEIEVTFGGGDQTRYRARWLGGDLRNDIALLRIDLKGNKMRPLPLGDSSKLQVGQRVLAIGNPFGFQSTLTTGVVSALGRTVQTGQQTFIDEALQTDAAINRGNSGGPLLNSAGEVVGMNTAIYTPTGVTAGIGFAIPINTAKMIVRDLLTEGRVRRAILGIQGSELWPALADALELPVREGILVEFVIQGGPAEQAAIRGGTRRVLFGLRQVVIGGDVITAIDGQPITSHLALNVFLNRKRPGDQVTVTIYRGRQKMDVRATLGER